MPHIARQLFGSDLRQSLPASAVLGALLLLVADIAARVVILPQEVPVGVMTALMGAPFFILLAQRGETMPDSQLFRMGPFSRQFSPRLLPVLLACLLITMLVTLVALGIGDVAISLPQTFGSCSSLTPARKVLFCMSYVYHAWRWRYWLAAA